LSKVYCFGELSSDRLLRAGSLGSPGRSVVKDFREVLVGRPFSLSRERVREARDGVKWNRMLRKVALSENCLKVSVKSSTLYKCSDIDSNCIVFSLTWHNSLTLTLFAVTNLNPYVFFITLTLNISFFSSILSTAFSSRG
jgi:hypothetical protein